MSLLLDENLSRRSARRLEGAFPGVTHVDLIGLRGAADHEIWKAAGDGGHTIVSKDADFYQRSVTYGPPPKVVWLRVGNGPSSEVEGLLLKHREVLFRFEADPEAGFLAI